MLRLNTRLPEESNIVLRGEGGKWGESGGARTEPAELCRGPQTPQQSFLSSVTRGEEGCEILLPAAHSWAAGPGSAGNSRGFVIPG